MTTIVLINGEVAGVADLTDAEVESLRKYTAARAGVERVEVVTTDLEKNLYGMEVAFDNVLDSWR